MTTRLRLALLLASPGARFDEPAFNGYRKIPVWTTVGSKTVPNSR